jgi:hypothetical protein
MMSELRTVLYILRSDHRSGVLGRACQRQVSPPDKFPESSRGSGLALLECPMFEFLWLPQQMTINGMAHSNNYSLPEI